MRLPLACQVAYECFSFTPVPQTGLKRFNLESSLDKAWLDGKLSLGGLDGLPEPCSQGTLEQLVQFRFDGSNVITCS